MFTFDNLRRQLAFKPGFNTRIALCSCALLAICSIGLPIAQVEVPGARDLWLALIICVSAFGPILFYLRKAKWNYLVDSLLVLFWGIFYYVTLFLAAALAGRIGMHFSLTDSSLVALDRFFHLDIPALVLWSAHNWFGQVANKSYPLLFPFMWAAILIPIVTGRLQYAQRFIGANAVAFALALPFFALFPAVGPWYGYHMHVDAIELQAQVNLFQLRAPGPYLYHPPSYVICFPSFHVIWAILCACTFWGFRWLRIPAALFACLIIFSTMGTGVHYLPDVIGAIPIAAAAQAVAKKKLAP